MPVDVAALVGVGEEGDGPRDVLGTGEAGHRGADLDVGLGVAAAGLVLVVNLVSRIPIASGCAFVSF